MKIWIKLPVLIALIILTAEGKPSDAELAVGNAAWILIQSASKDFSKQIGLGTCDFAKGSENVVENSPAIPLTFPSDTPSPIEKFVLSCRSLDKSYKISDVTITFTPKKSPAPASFSFVFEYNYISIAFELGATVPLDQTKEPRTLYARAEKFLIRSVRSFFKSLDGVAHTAETALKDLEDIQSLAKTKVTKQVEPPKDDAIANKQKMIEKKTLFGYYFEIEKVSLIADSDKTSEEKIMALLNLPELANSSTDKQANNLNLIFKFLDLAVVNQLTNVSMITVKLNSLQFQHQQVISSLDLVISFDPQNGRITIVSSSTFFQIQLSFNYASRAAIVFNFESVLWRIAKEVLEVVTHIQVSLTKHVEIPKVLVGFLKQLTRGADPEGLTTLNELLNLPLELRAAEISRLGDPATGIQLSSTIKVNPDKLYKQPAWAFYKSPTIEFYFTKQEEVMFIDVIVNADKNTRFNYNDDNELEKNKSFNSGLLQSFKFAISASPQFNLFVFCQTYVIDILSNYDGTFAITDLDFEAMFDNMQESFFPIEGVRVPVDNESLDLCGSSDLKHIEVSYDEKIDSFGFNDPEQIEDPDQQPKPNQELKGTEKAGKRMLEDTNGGDNMNKKMQRRRLMKLMRTSSHPKRVLLPSIGKQWVI